MESRELGILCHEHHAQEAWRSSLLGLPPFKGEHDVETVFPTETSRVGLLGVCVSGGEAESLLPLARPQGISQTPTVLKICQDLTDVRAESQSSSADPTTWGMQ